MTHFREAYECNYASNETQTRGCAIASRIGRYAAPPPDAERREKMLQQIKDLNNARISGSYTDVSRVSLETVELLRAEAERPALKREVGELTDLRSAAFILRNEQELRDGSKVKYDLLADRVDALAARLEGEKEQ